MNRTIEGPVGRFLDWPLWRSTLLLSVVFVALSGSLGVAIVYALFGVLETSAVVMSFLIPAMVVPAAAFVQLYALRRARHSERELSRFFATTGALLAIGDFTGRFTRLSPSWERLLGHTPLEMSAVHFSEFLHPDDVEPTMKEVKLLTSGGHQTSAFLNRFRHKHGDYCWLQWNATADTRRRLIYATAVDVTARVEAESFKDSLISTVNHEIRTPLASLFAALKISTGMQATDLPEQTARMLEIAEANAERLVRIIDNTLDLERIQTGNVEYRLTPHPVNALIDTAAEQARFAFEDAGVGLETVDQSHGAGLLVDELRLQQILGNLLTNAAKFAPAGSTVRLAAYERDGIVRLSVTDQGPGIPPSERERVFDRFYQVSGHDKGGSGLGLAISKTLAEGMSGEIGVEEAPDGGAVFFVRFPVHDMKAAETPTEQEPV